MSSNISVVKVPKIVWWIIWGMMLSSMAVYLVVLQVVERDVDTEVASILSLKHILLIVAAASVVVSFGIRFLLTSQQARHADEKKRAAAFSTYVFSIALAEASALYGLVLGMMGATFSDYAVFFVIGFFAMILQPPTVLFPSKGDDIRSRLRPD